MRMGSIGIIGAIVLAGLCACSPSAAPTRQLAAGFNGPPSQKADVFRSEGDVRASWVAQALSPNALENLIKRTDFSRNVLIGFGVGKRPNASGKISISELRYDKEMRGYFVFIWIGVVPETCRISSANSYPFVIGKVPIAGPTAKVTGYFLQNFEDGCRPVTEATTAIKNP